ncbi:LamG domain-containing protein, partial [Candidatus Woesearchaeota archaeon]|nr:LamG domain-containing protein [Candidatus Woesearchaeota archaeon]
HLYYIAIVDFDNLVDEENEENNIATTLEAVPTHGTPILNATDHPLNRSDANLTVYNQSTSPGVKNIIDWRLNTTSITLLNMPFESHKNNNSFAIDYSTFNNVGTVQGALFNASIGYDGKAAYEFTGTNTGILVPNVNATNYTITAWIKPDQVNNYENLFYWQGSGTYFALTNAICAYVTSWSCTGTAPTVGAWMHLAITSQGKVYKNGIYLGTITVEPVSGNLSIGDRDTATWDFDGVIDEFQLYNRVLSAEQIQALYRTETNILVSQETQPLESWTAGITPNDGVDGKTEISNSLFINYGPTPPTHNTPLLLATDYPSNTTAANLTVYNQSTSDLNNDVVKNIIDWRLQGSSIALINFPFEKLSSYQTTTKDYSSFTRNGTVSGAVFNATGGYDTRGSYEFDGVNDYISTTLTYTSGTNISTGGWYKSSDNLTTNMVMVGGNNDGRFEVYVDQAKPGCRIWDTADRSIYAPEPASSGWHHIVCTQTYNSNTTKLYVDGVLKASTNYNSISAGGTWQIGKPGSSGAKYFNGTIDKVFIMNRSLSQEQILSLYVNGSYVLVNNETNKNDVWSATLTPHDGNEEGTTKTSNTITTLNSPPTTPLLLIEQNNSHTNDNTTTFTWSQASDYDTDAVHYEFVIANNTNFNPIIINPTNIIDTNYTLVQQLNDSIYYWKVRSCDISNKCSSYQTPFVVVIDTINPNIQWIYPQTDNSSKNYEHNISWDIKVSDSNLYNVLLNVTNATGYSMYSEYVSNISGTTYNFTNITDVASWSKGNYTVEASAGDDHTYGSLHDLTYTINSDGILFSDGNVNKKISIGYFIGGNYVFAQASDIQSNNILFNAQELNKEYKWVMNIKRPQNDIQLGFAIPAEKVILRNKDKAHFVWDDWYIDFEDLISNGFPIKINKQTINNEEYWIVSTSTSYCKANKGQTCTFDPVVGGLNIVTQYKTIYINKKPVHNLPILNATDYPTNSTNANLTVHNQSTIDLDDDLVKNIYDWRLNSNSMSLLNLPFENNNEPATSTKDYSTNQKNGTISGAVFNATGGVDGFSAYEFDGVNDYINTQLNYLSSINITISAWYKTFDNLTAKMAIVGGNNRGRFESYVNQGKPGCRIWDTGERSIYASQQFISGWHHIVCTQTFFPNTTSLYVDGVLQASANYSSISAGGTWRIGYPGSSGAKYFNGTIDEVMIVNRSLSAEQIKSLAQQRNDLLVSEETEASDIWSVVITPNDKLSDGNTKASNAISVLGKNVWNGVAYLNTCSITINNTESINHIYEPQAIDPTVNCNFTNSLQADRDDIRLIYQNITEIPIAAETDADYIIALLNSTARNTDSNYTLFWGNSIVERTNYSDCTLYKPCTYEFRGDLFKVHDRFDDPTTGYNITFWNVQSGNCGPTTVHVYEGVYGGNCTNGGLLFVDISAPNIDPTYSGAVIYDEGDTGGSNGNAFMDASSGEARINGAGERTDIHSSKYVYTQETGGWNASNFTRYTGWKAVNMKSTFANKEIYFNTTLIGNLTQTSAANDPSEIVRYKIGNPTTATNNVYFDFFAYGKNEFHLYDTKAKVIVGDK